jgi:hypothetical protein
VGSPPPQAGVQATFGGDRGLERSQYDTGLCSGCLAGPSKCGVPGAARGCPAASGAGSARRPQCEGACATAPAAPRCGLQGGEGGAGTIGWRIPVHAST